jgi:hypothetical protein
VEIWWDRELLASGDRAGQRPDAVLGRQGQAQGATVTLHGKNQKFFLKPRRGAGGHAWAVGNDVIAGTGPIGGEGTMESYPRRVGALLTVVAVEGAHVVAAGADGVRHRARCMPSGASGAGEPLKPGDVCVVDHVDPAEGCTVVERVNTRGQRDGARYALVGGRLASTSEPA